jgi:hypothetical protein
MSIDIFSALPDLIDLAVAAKNRQRKKSTADN